VSGVAEGGAVPLLLLASGLAGALGFAAAARFLLRGGALYSAAFRRQVVGGLREAFVYLDPRLLLALTAAAALALGALAAWAAGPAAGLAAAVAALVAPRLVVARLRARRARRIVRQLPDALTALAGSLRGGSNVLRGLEQIAARHPAPLSQEIALVLAEYRLGRPLEEALEAMARRLGRREIDLMNAAIGIARAVGGNLADTLDALAETLRETARLEGKIDALTAMGRMQGWLVAGLPFAIAAWFHLTRPEDVAVLYTTRIGLAVLVVLALMYVAGALMLRRIVRIDV